MSGTVIRLVEQTDYNFGDLKAAANSEQYVTLAQHIDTSQFRTAGLLVRVVSISWGDTTNDTLDILVANDMWDPMEGTTLYTPLGDYAAPLTASLNPNAPSAAPTSPYGMYFPLSDFGALVMVSLHATRSASSTGSGPEAQIIVDLILKD